MTKIPVKRGRRVDTGKRDHILQVATELFMKQGFGATSMDQIASAAKISKLTLYNRFQDKNVLFIEVIATKSREYVPDDLFDVFVTKTPREAIYTVSKALFALLLSDDAIRLHRTMTSDAPLNPEMAKLFYACGPMRIRTLMADKMRLLNNTGVLSIPDEYAATILLISLFKGSDIYLRRTLNIGKKPTAKEIEAHLLRAVDFFMRAYAPTPKPPRR